MPEWHVGTLVGALFLGRCPSAIRRLVVAVVVDPVEGKTSGWAWPHVFEECRERAQPPLANLYSAAAISRIFLGSWVRAAGFHSRPYLVLGRSAEAVLSDHCEPSLSSLISEHARYRAEWIARSPFARVVLRAKFQRPSGSVAAVNRACGGRLVLHRETFFLGVTGQAVPAALPSNYTSVLVAA